MGFFSSEADYVIIQGTVIDRLLTLLQIVFDKLYSQQSCERILAEAKFFTEGAWESCATEQRTCGATQFASKLGLKPAIRLEFFGLSKADGTRLRAVPAEAKRYTAAGTAQSLIPAYEEEPDDWPNVC